LRVFSELPQDESTSRCFDSFTVLASDDRPFSPESAQADLRTKTFGAWPVDTNAGVEPRVIAEKELNGMRLSIYQVESQTSIQLRMYILQPVDKKIDRIEVELVDQTGFSAKIQLLSNGFSEILADELNQLKNEDGPQLNGDLDNWIAELKEIPAAFVLIAPRCVGTTALGGDQNYLKQIKRRFMLVGATLASSQVWDTIQCLRAIRSIESLKEAGIKFGAAEAMTEVACFAVLFGPKVDILNLEIPPRADRQAADFLNWSRIVTPSQLKTLVQQNTGLVVP
jgi:hypothetical protein